jgi:trk system potassium uptake protein
MTFVCSREKTRKVMDNIFECDAPRSKGRKQGLINTRLIIYILGVLVLVEAGLFALCAGVSLLYEEYRMQW